MKYVGCQNGIEGVGVYLKFTRGEVGSLEKRKRLKMATMDRNVLDAQVTRGEGRTGEDRRGNAAQRVRLREKKGKSEGEGGGIAAGIGTNVQRGGCKARMVNLQLEVTDSRDA